MTDSSKWQFCKTCDEYHEFGDDEHGVRQHLVTCRPGSPPTDDDTPAPPSNLTPPEPSDAEAIDRIAAYLRRNGYVEVTIWESGGAVYRREHLHDALAQVERDRDEVVRERERAEALDYARAMERASIRQSGDADAYHAIRETLGMDDDTDPQEVVDAVGRMRKLLRESTAGMTVGLRGRIEAAFAAAKGGE